MVMLWEKYNSWICGKNSQSRLRFGCQADHIYTTPRQWLSWYSCILYFYAVFQYRHCSLVGQNAFWYLDNGIASTESKAWESVQSSTSSTSWRGIYDWTGTFSSSANCKSKFGMSWLDIIHVVWSVTRIQLGRLQFMYALGWHMTKHMCLPHL